MAASRVLSVTCSVLEWVTWKRDGTSNGTTALSATCSVLEWVTWKRGPTSNGTALKARINTLLYFDTSITLKFTV